MQRYSVDQRRNSKYLSILLVTTALLTICICGLLLRTRFSVSNIFGNGWDADNVHSSSNSLSERFQADGCRNICTSQQCIQAAAHTFRRIDPSVDPCDDFYEFSCGNFLDTEQLPEESETMNFVQEASLSLKLELKSIIKSLPAELGESIPGTILGKIKRAYNHCMEPSTSEEMTVVALKKFLSESGMKDWPHLKAEWSPQNITMAHLMAKFAALDKSPLFRVLVRNTREKSDEENNDNVSSLEVWLCATRQPLRYIINDDSNNPWGKKKIQQYRSVTKTIFTLLGISDSGSNILVDEIIEFEASLANLPEISYKCQLDPDDLENSDYEFLNCFNDDELNINNKWCQIAKHYFDELDATNYVSMTAIKLEDKMYFNLLEELLNNFPERIIGNYLSVHFIFMSMSELSLPFRRLLAENQVLFRPNGYPEPFNENWKRCISWLMLNFPQPLLGQYMMTNFNSTVEKEVRDVVSILRETTVSMLNNLSWVNEELRRELSEKIAEIQWNSEKFKEYVNQENFEKYYKKLRFEDEAFFSNVMELEKFRQSFNLQCTIRQNKDCSTFFSDKPLKMDASYDGAIFLQPGFLRFPAFVFERPRYLTYGTLGVSVGHEFGHGFLEFIDHFEDKATEETMRIYQEKVACISDQYSAYEIDLININVDGSVTFDENFSDQIGIRTAFLALQRYIEEHGEEAGLPGLSYSNKQLFFIAYAQMWCEIRSEQGYEDYLIDKHSPFTYRVRGSLSNFPAFAETFDCPIGSPMNPEFKCAFAY